MQNPLFKIVKYASSVEAEIKRKPSKQSKLKLSIKYVCKCYKEYREEIKFIGNILSIRLKRFSS